MILALSPYHLTTRETPAMAALLLSERVVTMMPVPASGTADPSVRAAIDQAPSYLKFMESWQWSLPLWRDGVIGSVFAGEDAADEMVGVCEKIDREPAYAMLRPMLRRSLFDDDKSYLSSLAVDLLKGGPDPGISVPVAAALDRFASRHGLAVARSAPTSIAQKAEGRLGRRVFGTALPVLVQAEGAQLLLARRLLGAELGQLRRAIAALVGEQESEASTPGAMAINELDDAVREYTEAFARHRAELLTPRDEDDVHPIESTVTIAGVSLPGNAVLRSSADAMAAVSGRGRATAGRGRGPADDGAGDPGPRGRSPGLQPRVQITRRALGFVFGTLRARIAGGTLVCVRFAAVSRAGAQGASGWKAR